MPPQTPNWTIWQQRLTAKLWEAVALSLNIDPEHLPGKSRDIYGDVFSRCPQDFQSRLEIAIDHLNNKSLQSAGYYTPTAEQYADVRLVEFLSWAEKMNWDLPKEFHEIAEKLALPNQSATTKKLGRPTEISREKWLEHLAILALAGKVSSRNSQEAVATALIEALRKAEFPERSLDTVRKEWISPLMREAKKLDGGK